MTHILPPEERMRACYNIMAEIYFSHHPLGFEAAEAASEAMDAIKRAARILREQDPDKLKGHPATHVKIVQ